MRFFVDKNGCHYLPLNWKRTWCEFPLQMLKPESWILTHVLLKCPHALHSKSFLLPFPWLIWVYLTLTYQLQLRVHELSSMNIKPTATLATIPSHIQWGSDPSNFNFTIPRLGVKYLTIASTARCKLVSIFYPLCCLAKCQSSPSLPNKMELYPDGCGMPFMRKCCTEILIAISCTIPQKKKTFF